MIGRVIKKRRRFGVKWNVEVNAPLFRTRGLELGSRNDLKRVGQVSVNNQTTFRVPDDDLSASEGIVPPDDLSLDEARQLFEGEGLIPDLPAGP